MRGTARQHDPLSGGCVGGDRIPFLAKYGEMDRALELLKGVLPHLQNKNILSWRKLEFYRGALRALSVLGIETVDEEMNIGRLVGAFEQRNSTTLQNQRT